MRRILTGLLLATSFTLASGQAVVDPKTRKVDLKGTYTAPHRETIEQYLNGQNDIMQQLDARLKKLESAVVTTPPSSTTAVPIATVPPSSTITTPAPATLAMGSTGYFADSTKFRVEESKLMDKHVANEAQLRSEGFNDLTDTRLILDFPRYTGELAILGKWINVKVQSTKLYSFEFYRKDWSNNVIINDRKPFERVEFFGLVFRSDYQGWGDPMIWNTELRGIKGICLRRCSFFGNYKGQFNAIGSVQYSQASKHGEQSEGWYITHCYFKNVPRMDIELLNQDPTIRIRNVVITHCVQENDSTNDGEKHRMFSSVAGGVTDVYQAHNKLKNPKDIGIELVHVNRALLEHNDITAKLETCSGYSFTDDWGGKTTSTIIVRGGNLDVTGRPFQVYGPSNRVRIDGMNKLWKSHRGVQMSAQDSRFENLNLLIHSTAFEAAFEFDGISARDTLANSVINTIGSIQAGYVEPFEAVATRQNTSDILIENVVGKIGKMPNGSFHFDTGINVDKGQRITVKNFKVEKEQ